MARGYKVEILPGAIDRLGHGHFRQGFLVRIDDVDYRTFLIEWTEKASWWKRWKIRIYRVSRKG
jgi:hypothetical protein